MPPQKRRAVAAAAPDHAATKPTAIPFDEKFSYTPVAHVADEDLKQYLHEPVDALPPVIRELLPPINIVLAPYLEKSLKQGVTVVTEKPAEGKLAFSSHEDSKDSAVLYFTIRGEQISDYHFYLYEELAQLISDRCAGNATETYRALLREELSNEVHGEVEEKSWRLKQSLLRKPKAQRKDGLQFQAYARRSFEDTMTLYLHGICCDIDVETGPRQLPSRILRKRLETLKKLFPPPAGLAVFPEDADHKHHHRHEEADSVSSDRK